MIIEQRNLRRPVEFRAATDDKPATISGYAAVFYNEADEGTQYRLWDDAVERILPGAFDRSIAEGEDVRGLFNHDVSRLLGRSSVGTLKLSVDSTGLRYEITPGDTSVARDVLTYLQRGELDGSSFGFSINPGGESWRLIGNTEIRELTDLRVVDVGPVTFPAYTASTAESRTSARESRDEWAALHKQRAEDRRELTRLLLRSSVSAAVAVSNE